MAVRDKYVPKVSKEMQESIRAWLANGVKVHRYPHSSCYSDYSKEFWHAVCGPLFGEVSDIGCYYHDCPCLSLGVSHVTNVAETLLDEYWEGVE